MPNESREPGVDPPDAGIGGGDVPAPSNRNRLILISAVVVVGALASLTASVLFGGKWIETPLGSALVAATPVIWAALGVAAAQQVMAKSSERMRPSGSRDLLATANLAFYPGYARLWSGGTRAAQSVLPSMDFRAKPVAPDEVELRVDKSRHYRLPSALTDLEQSLRSVYRWLPVKFAANDKIGIVTGIVREDGRIVVNLERGRMIDEYVTIQNPEMNYHRTDIVPDYTRKATVNDYSVRAFFAQRSLERYPNQALIPLDSVRPDGESESGPGYRLAAHLVILVGPSNGSSLKDVAWPEREFLYVDRSKTGRHATGLGELSSSSCSGVDYSDLSPIVRSGRARKLGYIPLTDYVLRELRYEQALFESDLEKLYLVGFTRDMERLGQPVAILIGQTRLRLDEITRRHSKARGLMGWAWMLSHRRAGWELWEAERVGVRKVKEIPKLLVDDQWQTGTKSCLYFLNDPTFQSMWDSLPSLN